MERGPCEGKFDELTKWVRDLSSKFDRLMCKYESNEERMEREVRNLGKKKDWEEQVVETQDST